MVVGAIGLMLTRPTAAGNNFTPVGIGIIGFMFGAMLLSSGATRKLMLSTKSIQIWAMIYLAGYYSFLVLGGRPYHQDMLIKAVGILISGSILGFCVIASEQRLRSFFDTLARIIIGLSASTIITIILLVVGFSLGQLAYTRLDYGYPQPAGTILFPFSMVYNFAPTPFGLLPRLSGGFREVGIFPAFACWAAAYAAFRRWSILSISLCLGAAVASFSTLGAMLALVTLGGILAKFSRIPSWVLFIAAPILGVAAVAITYNLPYIGLGYKYTQVNASFSERQYATETALNIPNPLLGADDSGVRNIGINLISSISTIGIIGVVIVLVGMLPAVRRMKYFVAALLPLTITAVFSQPIATEPLFLLLFISWRVFDTDEESQV